MDNRDLELLQAIQAMIDPLKDDMQDVKERLGGVESEVRKTNLIIETEIRKHIQILAEGHQTLKERLWHLPDEVEELKESVSTIKFLQTTMAKDVWKNKRRKQNVK